MSLPSPCPEAQVGTRALLAAPLVDPRPPHSPRCAPVAQLAHGRHAARPRLPAPLTPLPPLPDFHPTLPVEGRGPPKEERSLPRFLEALQNGKMNGSDPLRG